MSTVFANLRPESKYYEGQKQDKPFPVRFVPDICGYHWEGGIGGQYRTSDLFFYTEINVQGSVELRQFEVVNPSDLNQMELTKVSVLKGIGKDWGSSYWENLIKLLESVLRKARKELKAQEAREEREREEERIERNGW
ncbi:hypothetical protein [Endozoicomonas ascidiicola]|uniref:hypothetical protein n=1 Tax=Endozoicomonas ascidiicola TaxID=1698521 RepID=UPI0008363787|nr:hypothetical protein [Endozoicomonas ascidiicola]